MSASQVGPRGMTAFVPNGSGGFTRAELATVLVGTAEEAGIDQRAIASTSGGFYISDELADLLYDEQDSEQEAEAEQVSGNPEPEVETPKKSTRKRSSKKTSGNRAAKNTDSKEE